MFRVVLVLFALVLVGGGVGYWYADQALNRDRHRPKVLAAPPEAPAQNPMPSYDGPHPRLLERPDEVFPFPLREGDVGPVEPLFAGPVQYPFLCRTVDSGLGQPLIDNHAGVGMAVFAERGDGQVTTEVVGYSKDCRLPTRISHWVYSRDTDGFEPAEEIPVERRQRAASRARERDLLVRVETGTINRHIYLIAIPVPVADDRTTPRLDLWNRRLIYYFRGGVGVGHRQGRTAIGSILKRRQEELQHGYAIAYSSANQTSTSYNIWLSEDTALRVKRQFVTAYAQPEYTVGLGGSGGAIQQYLLGQNRPGLLDAAIALYSYPDMITQSIHVLDCSLLEHYFDTTAALNPRWHSVAARSAVEGMHFHPDLAPRFWPVLYLSALARGQWPPIGRGTTECARAWRGMSALVLNPRYAHFSTRFVPELARQTNFSYWDDLKHWFGTEANGYARRTWDNVGVQYGLRALRQGQISMPEFLDLNRRIGGWKQAADMQAERYYLSDAGRSRLVDYAATSHHNMTLGGHVAPRTAADKRAIAAAWQSGQVFTGVIDIPVIDLRHYLEDQLDMHHASASFSARGRILKAMGDAGHQVIWVTRRPHQPYQEALDAIDRWLTIHRSHPQRALASNRPGDVTDRCWDGAGTIVAEGDGVWDSGHAPGACMRRYPIYGTSRHAAGESLDGNVFRCELQPVTEAIQNGLYDPADASVWTESLLEIFPQGVCRVEGPGPSYPRQLIPALLATVGPRVVR